MECKVKHKFIPYKVSISGDKLLGYCISSVPTGRRNSQGERKKITCWFVQGHWVGW